MAILTSNEILKRMDKGDIVISPFNKEQLNPNSYNVTLGDTLLVYSNALNNKILDPHFDKTLKTRKIKIPEKGFILRPNTLYLASINEYTETYNLVPKIEGRSSIGRLGLFIHVTAGYGDIGYKGNFTLELMCIHPVKIYPNMKIAQISYNTIEGKATDSYNGKYQNIKTPQGSKIYEDK